MVVVAARHRIGPPAHRRCQPSVSRPDGRRRIREGVSPFDVALNNVKTRFEAFQQRAEQPEGVLGVGKRSERVGVGGFLLRSSANVTAHCAGLHERR